MGNFMLAPKIGPIQAYGLAGIGLLRTTVDSAGQNNDQNEIAWGRRRGIDRVLQRARRRTWRRALGHAFQLIDFSRCPNLPVGDTKLDFGRFSVAMIFKF
jgi:hypothetical protein